MPSPFSFSAFRLFSVSLRPYHPAPHLELLLMAKDTDRQRLQQIEQTDITESRLNEDLVHWLKTSGPTYLLGILVGVTAILGYIRWSQYKTSQVNQAWIDLVNADRPESLEEVAEAHRKIFAVPLLARAEAADSYLRAVISGRDFSDDPALAPTLTDEQRADYLAKADRLYESIITAAPDLGADDDRNVLLHLIYANFGRAAVAEAKGEIESAKGFYNEVAGLAEEKFPALAEQARRRAADADSAAKLVFLPITAELPTRAPTTGTRTPLLLDEALENLIFPLDAPVLTDVPTGAGNISGTDE